MAGLCKSCGRLEPQSPQTSTFANHEIRKKGEFGNEQLSLASELIGGIGQGYGRSL